MGDIAQYNHENMAMKDIMAEIRDRVSIEANARHAREQTRVKKELLILRPEARVDLLVQEATPDSPPKSTSSAPDEFVKKLKQALGVAEPEALEALIRKVLREEMTAWGDR